MYNFDVIGNIEKDNLMYILNNKNLFPCIEENELVIYFDNDIIFKKNIDNLSFFDVSSILGFPVIDSRYVYYLISIAYDNSNSKKYIKKSLWFII